MDQNIDFNILDQITTYNYLEIQNNIQKYNKILNNQYHLNRALNEKKSDEIKEDLEEFLINKKSLVDNQIIKLDKIKNELKTIYEINKDLETKDKLLLELQNSKEMKDLAEKLAKLNNIQEDINFFLTESGLI